MNAPFFKYGLFGDETSLMVAFLIGTAFGFVLERAGFGNARVLAAQFYLRDLRVLKVMFTAIVTAMVGLFILSRIGFVDLSLVHLTPTYIAPQIVGGLILGAGFIIGGYCPGTSCVSAATGRIDGMVYLIGMIGGILGFAEIYPHIAEFAASTDMGRVTLAQYLDVPYGVLVLAVVIAALGAFIAAELAEKRFGGRAPGEGALLAPTRRLTSVRRLSLGLVVLGVFAAFAGNPYRGPIARVDAAQLARDINSGANRVGAEEIARWLVEGRTDFLLVDLRNPAAFARYHLPGAINVSAEALRRDFASREERIVFYADDDGASAQAVVLLRSLGYPAVYAIRGGLPAWRSEVLFPSAPPAEASAEARRDFQRRAALAKYFGGAAVTGNSGALSEPEVPIMAPQAPASGKAPAAVKKRKEGC